MTIRFYYGSGSPFSWKVWLALEHKQLSYNFNVLSLQQGEQKTPEYLAINSRSADFTLYPMLVLVTNSHNAHSVIKSRIPLASRHAAKDCYLPSSKAGRLLNVYYCWRAREFGYFLSSKTEAFERSGRVTHATTELQN